MPITGTTLALIQGVLYNRKGKQISQRMSGGRRHKTKDIIMDEMTHDFLVYDLQHFIISSPSLSLSLYLSLSLLIL